MNRLFTKPQNKIIIYMALLACVVSNVRAQELQTNKRPSWWEFQSIDTMKYSRDLAREKLKDPKFDEIIDTQVKNIAATGVTHVAIATPYDEEFFPILKRWVDAARKYNLNVWFRGNWSGWEQWFGYSKISREEHIKKTVDFINKHGDIFVSGDVFTACPECENGGNGDPRINGDIHGHREFLIEEYKQVSNTFRIRGNNVKSNFNPMNADVAKLIMDKETTKALGGLVVIDHYVKSPEQLAKDIVAIAKESGGKVVLGEMGAPIPDIHGKFTDEQQAAWIEKALNEVSALDELVGINYWVNIGGTTEIWNSDITPKKAVEKLTMYFSPIVSRGTVINQLGKPINNATISVGTITTKTNKNGEFEIKYIDPYATIYGVADSYNNKILNLAQNDYTTVVLEKSHENIFFKINKFFYNLFN